MSRPLRVEYSGAVYHITARGNARKKIFDDDYDREMFLSTLGAVAKRYNWVCHSFCLMDNHYHLIIETSDANLSIGMRQLNGIYTQKYNRRHKQPGHVFQGRFKAILVDKENYLLELCRYVVLNPVRAKIIEKPEQWTWSSYRATAGIDKKTESLTTDWILSMFSEERKKARQRYRKFITEKIKQESPWNKLKGQILLGDESFTDKFKNLLADKEKVKEIPRLQRHVGRTSLSKLFKETETKEVRDKAIHDAHMKHGYTLKDIADYLKIHYTTVSKIITKQERE
jgi:putative transposase